MTNEQTLQQNWSQIQHRLREKWCELSQNDFEGVNGDIERLVGVIQQRTQESRAAIEAYVDQCIAESRSMANAAAEQAREYYDQASIAAQQKYDELAAQVQHRMSEMESLIQQKPAQSVAAAFGVGVLAGVTIALLLKK